MPIGDRILKHKLLLDTHVWIWLMNENLIFLNSFYTTIERLASQDGILISPITIWEIGMLVEKKNCTRNGLHGLNPKRFISSRDFNCSFNSTNSNTKLSTTW